MERQSRPPNMVDTRRRGLRPTLSTRKVKTSMAMMDMAVMIRLLRKKLPGMLLTFRLRPNRHMMTRILDKA